MKKVIILLISVFILGLITLVWIYNSSTYIKINGDRELSIGQYEVYEELGATTLFHDEIKAIGKVDTGKIGKQIVKYCHASICKIRVVNVIDVTPPVIELNGSGETNVLKNGNYNELGAVAKDRVDGVVDVEISGEVDTTTIGTYKITYKAKDKSNNIAYNYRTINVIDKGPLALSVKDFNLKGYFDGTILKETKDAGWNYILDTIFYGDSITENMGWYLGDLPEANVWAIHSITPASAMTTKVPFNKYNEEISLIDGLKKYKPKRIIIQL